MFVAGQVSEDVQGDLVDADDFAAQRRAFANVGPAFAGAGAKPRQVTKLTIFVVGLRPEMLPAVEVGRVALFGTHNSADTLVSVEALAHAECLIEVEAIAVT